MDAVLSSFILTAMGAGVAGLVALINALSKCCARSRCTTIKTPCFSCDREVLSEDSEVYLEAQESQRA